MSSRRNHVFKSGGGTECLESPTQSDDRSCHPHFVLSMFRDILSDMKITWKGVFPAVTTQFRQDQSLDLDATAKHIDALIDSGISGLVMLGSLGENTALDPEEKRRVMELAIKASRGRVPVLSGVAENSTAAACRYARDMEKLGAGGLMVLPAMVYKADSRETIAHFRTVARSSGLPILVYNNPIAYGVDITPVML